MEFQVRRVAATAPATARSRDIRLAAHRMNLQRAHALLESAEGLGNSRGWGRLSAGAMLERARLYFSQGRTGEGAGCLERLERLAAQYQAPGHCAWSDIHRYAALARAYLALAEEHFDDATSTLSALQRELEGVQNLFFALRVETTLATVRFWTRQIGAALSSLGGIVAKLAPSGFYHGILDQGVEIGPLLAAFHENAKRTGGSPGFISYISNLIAAWRSRYQSDPQQPQTSAIVESLSVRECAILKLIAGGNQTRRLLGTWRSLLRP